MRKLEEFLSATIVLEPQKGVTAGPCIREALILALEENCKVSFMFNDRLLTCDPNAIIQELWKQICP